MTYVLCELEIPTISTLMCYGLVYFQRQDDSPRLGVRGVQWAPQISSQVPLLSSGKGQTRIKKVFF